MSSSEVTKKGWLMEKKTQVVLVVDDEPVVRQLLTELLSGKQRSVEGFATAQEALAASATSPVHLALIDRDLPGNPRYRLAIRLLIFVAPTTSCPQWSISVYAVHDSVLR